MIMIIEDDKVIAKCVARASGRDVRVFSDAITAMNEIGSTELPKMIFLDLMPTGPDGFAFLNEIISYDDTAKIPIVIISDYELDGKDLSTYGVVEALQKEKMTPGDVKRLVTEYAK